MSSDILGNRFDIHGGGIDLIFPHHENEIAQSEGAGRKFANYWIHNGLLTINKEKMAKSMGNFITIEDILAKYSADVLKILFLQTHYSHPVDFSWEKMDEAKKAYERIDILMNKLKNIKAENDSDKNIDKYRLSFERAMDDDFNMPEALAVLFDLVTYINKNFTEIDLNNAKDVLMKLGNVFGLFEQKINSVDSSKKAEIEHLIDLRNAARKNRDFKEADKIRKELEKAGIILEDTKDGTTWRRKI
jgi:cysteinyl-tRNA synthetase